MITGHNQFDIETCVNQLLTVLDKDIEQIETNISSLNELRAFVVKQDHDALSGLLDTLRSKSEQSQDNQSQRQTLRSRLGKLLNFPAEQVTLSQLENRLEQNLKTQITERKDTLRRLTTTLRKEYMSTQMLLTDCARFNQTLLRGIFENSPAKAVTYTPSGKSERAARTVFMNVQL